MSGPLDGIAVVEVAVGVSDLGLGHAGGLPGRLLADLGATVTRVVGTEPVAIDADVPWGRVWHRDKRVVATDDAVRDRRPAAHRRRRLRLRRRGDRRGPRPRPRRPDRRQPRARLRPLPAEPHRGGRGRGLRPPRRGPSGVLHAARRPPTRPDAGRRAGQRHGDVVPADHLRARAAAPSGPHRRRRLGRHVPLRRSARHARLHDRPQRAGRAEDRVVLGGGILLPELPLPVRRRRAGADLVRRQGHVRQRHRGARRRAQRGGLLRRADERTPHRSGGAMEGRVRHPTSGGVDRTAAGRRRGVRARARTRRGAGRPAPGRDRARRHDRRRRPPRRARRSADRGPADRPGASRPAPCPTPDPGCWRA